MTLRRAASTASCRELGVSPSRDQNCENNPMQSRDRASHDSRTQDLVAGLPASRAQEKAAHPAQPPILSHPALAALDAFALPSAVTDARYSFRRSVLNRAYFSPPALILALSQPSSIRAGRHAMMTLESVGQGREVAETGAERNFCDREVTPPQGFPGPQQPALDQIAIRRPLRRGPKGADEVIG